MDKNNYFIKKGYKRNDKRGKETMFDGMQDSVKDSMVSQYRVYENAAKIIKKNNLKSVLDIGCGVGAKLKLLIYPLTEDITGIDEKATIKWCKQYYFWGKWYVDNLENPKLKLNRKYDLIICSDVIEHLLHPERLLEMIKKCSHSKTIIILSTPDRDAIYGCKHMGAPRNLYHYQEWNRKELRQYMEHEGFTIIGHYNVYATILVPFLQAKFLGSMAWIFAKWISDVYPKKSPFPEGQVIIARYG